MEPGAFAPSNLDVRAPSNLDVRIDDALFR